MKAPKKTTKKSISLRLDSHAIAELELAAQMEQSNVSCIIRKAIDSYLFDIGGELELYAEQLREHNRNEHLLDLIRGK